MNERNQTRNSQVVELRVVFDPDVNVDRFLHDMGLEMGGSVWGITELRNDGFGRLLPSGFAEVFVSPPDPTEARIQKALETGEAW